MKKFYLFIVSVFSIVALHANNYYVDPINGNNSNSGLIAILAKSTIQAASNLTNPGDTVFLMSGTYTASTNVTRPGATGQYITYKAQPGNTPKIYISGAIWNAVVINASYVVFEGIEFKGDNDNLTYADAYNAYMLAAGGGAPNAKYNTNGISIGGPNTQSLFPHHVTIRNCKIHDFPGGGLSSIQADYTTIEGNTVYNNAWYMMYAGSGVSILNPVNSDAADINLYKNIIRNNIVYGNKTTIPWISLTPPALSDGNGIIIDVNQYGYGMTAGSGTEYKGRTLVQNNLSFNNGGSGIHAFKADHVDIINNTAFGNGTVVGYADIYAGASTDVKIINNMMYARAGGKCNEAPSSGTTVTYDYNVYYNGTVNAQGIHDIIADPQFVNPSTNGAVAVFSLKANSPAIDAGSNSAGQFSATDIIGVTRPFGSKPDMGAYEFIGVATPVAPVTRNVTALSIAVGNPGTPSRPYPVTLSEYSPSGTATGITVAIPSTTADNRLLIGGTNPLDGQLNLSGDGKYLTFAGYDVDAGISIGTAYTATKVIGRVGSNGTVDISTKIPASVAYANASVRSVVTQDGSGYWVTGGSSTGTTNGTQYLVHGATAAANQVNATGNKSLGVFKNVLYVDNSGIGSFAGLPTSLSSVTGGNGTFQASYPNNTQFVFLDTDPGFSWGTTGYDMLYIADAVTSGANLNVGLGISKFYINAAGTSWVFAGGAPYDVTGSGLAIPALTGTINNVGKPVLYAVQGNALNNSVISITDAGGRTGIMSAVNTTVTTLASAGTANIFRGIAFSPAQQISLPIGITSFSGALINGKTALQWITATENNAMAFEVERSTDMVSFINLGRVVAKNERSGSIYNFEDASIANGLFYYRLKLMDKDGRFTYSNVVVMKKDGKPITLLSMFPNPVRSSITINHPKAIAGASVQIIAANGTMLMQHQTAVNATQTSIDVAGLRPGAYFLVFIHGGEKAVTGFVK